MSADLLARKVTIYKITCSGNNKVYVGSTLYLVRRKSNHFKMLENGKHYNRHMQGSWNKYGASTFSLEIIEECKSENRIEKEQYWIDELKSADPIFGLNVNPKAGLDRTGVKMTAKQIKAMSKRTLGKKHSEKTKFKMSASAKGKIKSEAHCLALSISSKKRGVSVELLAKLHAGSFKAAKARVGKKLPKEWCEAISRGQRGKKIPLESIEKMAKSLAKYTNRQVMDMRNQKFEGVTNKNLSIFYKTYGGVISRILNNKRLAYSEVFTFGVGS